MKNYLVKLRHFLVNYDGVDFSFKNQLEMSKAL